MFRTTVFLSLVIALFSCEVNEQGLAHEKNLLIGNWIDMQYDNTLYTFSRSDSLITQEYGIKFNTDQTLIERKNAGWCGTPPVFLQDFGGTWSREDSILSMNVEYWGGTLDRIWKIVSLDDINLSVQLLYEKYNNEYRYYYEEIFEEAYLDIYGDWELIAISGGIHGGGHELNFETLSIEKFGQYRFVEDEAVLERGGIIVEDQSSEALRISLEPDPGSDVFMYDSEKYVHLQGEDTLHLNSPCCDRFNYHFTRKK